MQKHVSLHSEVEFEYNIWCSSEELVSSFNNYFSHYKQLQAHIKVRHVDELLNDNVLNKVYTTLIQSSPVMAADFIRQVILRDLGGVYLDFDSEIVNVETFFNLMKYTDYFASEMTPQSYMGLANAIIGSKQGSVMATQSVQMIVQNVLDP